MDYIKEELQKIVYKLETQLNNYNEELKKSPSGRLINNRTSKKPAFFQAEVLPDGKYSRKHIPAGDTLINQLARKEYLTKLTKNLEKNIRLLNNLLKNYHSLDLTDLMKTMGRPYQLLDTTSFFKNTDTKIADAIPNIEELTDPDILPRCHAHRKWAEKNYRKNSYPFPEEILLTASGKRARSRGEIIICDRLDHFGIPYRYDQLIYFDDGTTISPDFTFEGKHLDEFYLEYCGKMDNNDYLRRHLAKRNHYERNGIVPWQNICYVYSMNNGISVPEIDSVIFNYILPRL